jgi:signal transduction histidine kinase
MPLNRLDKRLITDNSANVSLALTLIILIAASVLSYRSTQRFLSNDDLVAHTYQVIDASRSVLSNVKDAETGQRGYLLTGDPKYLEPFTNGTQAVDANIKTLKDLTRDNRDRQEQVEQLSVLVASKDAELSRTIELRQTGHVADALSLVRSGQGKATMDQIRSIVADMQGQERDLLFRRIKVAETNGLRTRLWLLLGFGIAIILVGVASVFIAFYQKQRREAELVIRQLNTELELRVQQRTALLEEANKELEAFSYSVSHDLRAPLRHINGFTELLEKKAADQLDDSSKRYITTIQGAAKHAGILVDDLLSFSRMGRSEMKSTSVNLDGIVAEVRHDFELDTDGREIEWQVAPLPPMPGDAAMLRLVFQNLIGNALKYTKPCKDVVIEIGVEKQERENVFYIRDNGVGFDMRYVDKLFGVFQRLHNKDDFEGTGIGLANVRRIIVRHGGRTWAEGEVGKGATFYFTLPIAPA